MHFLSNRVYYVRVNFVRVKSCIALIPCIKVGRLINYLWKVNKSKKKKLFR